MSLTNSGQSHYSIPLTSSPRAGLFFSNQFAMPFSFSAPITLLHLSILTVLLIVTSYGMLLVKFAKASTEQDGPQESTVASYEATSARVSSNRINLELPCTKICRSLRLLLLLPSTPLMSLLERTSFQRPLPSLVWLNASTSSRLRLLLPSSKAFQPSLSKNLL